MFYYYTMMFPSLFLLLLGVYFTSGFISFHHQKCFSRENINMLKIAHRGYSEKYGDNNMKAFREALYAGFDMIELDILLCRSGEIVIYHDTYIEEKYINQLDYKDLKKYNIILLEEFLEEFYNKDVLIYFDLKGEHNVVYPLIDLIKRWFSEEKMKDIYISAFNRRFLDPLVESNLPVKIGFTTENLFTNKQFDYLCKHAYFVCFHWTILDHEAIDYLKKKNLKIYTYTNKEAFILNHMLKYKIDGIVSNNKLEL